MTELLLKVDDHLAERFKEISNQKFHGDDATAFEYALKSLLSEKELDMLRLEQVVEQIQDDIEAAGGMTDEEIDAYIAAYRRQKRKIIDEKLLHNRRDCGKNLIWQND